MDENLRMDVRTGASTSRISKSSSTSVWLINAGTCSEGVANICANRMICFDAKTTLSLYVSLRCSVDGGMGGRTVTRGIAWTFKSQNFGSLRGSDTTEATIPEERKSERGKGQSLKVDA